MLYLHREQLSSLTALNTALPGSINLNLCAFDLIKTGAYKQLELCCCGEEELHGGLQPGSLCSLDCRGLPCPSVPSYLPPKQRQDVPLWDNPHALSSPSALFRGSCHSMHVKGSWDTKKICLAHPGSSSPPRDACHHHGWRIPMWHGHLAGKPVVVGQGPHLASLVTW